MLNFGMIAAGFASVMTLQGLFYIALGTFVGIIFGAVPGLSGSVAIALFIPVTYTLEPNISIALIMGLMMGGVSGGLISAILLNIPGTSASFGTTFDGHPMAMRGEAGKALGTGIVFSFIGGLLSMFCLILIAPTMAKFALKFGTWEYFTIAVFALAGALYGFTGFIEGARIGSNTANTGLNGGHRPRGLYPPLHLWGYGTAGRLCPHLRAHRLLRPGRGDEKRQEEPGHHQSGGLLL